MMPRSWLAVVCLVLGSLCASARAEPDDPARAASARALFEEGVALSDDGKWQDAADRFRRALTLRDSQVIRFNLATALIETGQVVEASELLRQVERDESADRKLRDDARTHLATAQKRTARLTVTTSGPQDGVTFMLDDQPLDPVQIGVALPADPGPHTLRALRGELELVTKEATLGAGEEQTVMLALPAVATPAQAARTVVQPEPVAERDEGPRPSRKLMWWGIGGGVVVAAAIVATVFITRSKARGDKTEDPYEGDFDPPSISVQVGP